MRTNLLAGIMAVIGGILIGLGVVLLLEQKPAIPSIVGELPPPTMTVLDCRITEGLASNKEIRLQCSLLPQKY